MLRNLFGTDEEEQEEWPKGETNKEVLTETCEYTLTKAEVRYPNGDSETVEFTNAEHDSHEIRLYDHNGYHLNVHNYRSPPLKYLNPTFEVFRRFSYSNIRDMEIQSREDKVAETEVKVQVTREKTSPSDDWNIETIGVLEEPVVTGVWDK